MHKQDEREAFCVSSPFLLEGMTRFIVSLVEDIVANTILLLQSCADLHYVVRSSKHTFQCHVDSLQKDRQNFWFLNELQFKWQKPSY